MSKSLEFLSKAFPPQPGEDRELNPGRYGKGLAQFLATALGERGVAVIGVTAEDWGWRVDVKGDDFPLWIGCGNLDSETDRFRCFVEPSKPSVGRWLSRKPTKPSTSQLASDLYAVLSANPEVEQLSWTD